MIPSIALQALAPRTPVAILPLGASTPEATLRVAHVVRADLDFVCLDDGTIYSSRNGEAIDLSGNHIEMATDYHFAALKQKPALMSHAH